MGGLTKAQLKALKRARARGHTVYVDYIRIKAIVRLAAEVVPKHSGQLMAPGIF